MTIHPSSLSLYPLRSAHSQKEVPTMSKLQLFHTRRNFIKTSLAAAAGLGLTGLKAQRAFHHRPLMDDPTTHNMMVVGTRTVYLSHLPMFESVSNDGAEFTSPHR